jgi:ParB family chromosome partitioning protein
LPLVKIETVKVGDRIRKEFGNIEELAHDIDKTGLINPIVVTPDMELIAGERRLRAHQFLNRTEIEVRVMEIADYEHQLRLEISENEHRKEFSFSERMEWARRLEEVERLKAKDRMAGKENFPDQESGQVRDIVAEQAGFGSGKQYDKAKFIAENATPEIIQQLDAGLISTHKAFVETKENLEKEVREANERADKAEEEAAKLQKQYRNSVPLEQVEDAVSAAVERTQEENAAFVAQKEKEAAAALKQRDEHWKSELKKQTDEERIKAEQLRSGYKQVKEELEALKLQQPDDFDEQEEALKLKKLRFEADHNTVQLSVHVKQFLQKAGITTFMLGAVASASSSEKKRLFESLEMLQTFIDQIKPAVNGRKVV